MHKRTHPPSPILPILTETPLNLLIQYLFTSIFGRNQQLYPNPKSRHQIILSLPSKYIQNQTTYWPSCHHPDPVPPSIILTDTSLSLHFTHLFSVNITFRAILLKGNCDHLRLWHKTLQWLPMGLGAKAEVLSELYKVLWSSVHHPCAVPSWNSLPLLLRSRNPSLFAFPHKNVRLAPAPWPLHLLFLRKQYRANAAGGIMLPGFRLSYKAAVIKTVCYWPKNRNTDQQNRTESPETKPRTYGHLIYEKGGRNMEQRKDSPFNKWLWENWAATCKR